MGVKKERNYTIELVRFVFAINFLLIHVFAVVPRIVGAEPPFTSLYDTIIPFMAFSGFFLMQSFDKKYKQLEGTPTTAGHQAWLYLKARLVSLMPLFILATLLAAIGFCLIIQLPPIVWPKYFLDILCEFFGLQITGFGCGNAFVGTIPERATGISGSMANGPLWFMSGIFICGYLIYYLLWRNRDKFVSFIAPVTILLYYGSCYMTDTLPLWTVVHELGGLAVASGFLNMFCGMSLGVLMNVACNSVKDKEWSPGFKALLAVVQILCTILVMIRTWVSSTSPIYGYLDYGWGVAFLLSTIFTFLCVFNQDYFTRCPLFSNKIWAIPGRLALYIYALHYPIILFVTRGMGITQGMGEIYLDNIWTVFAISTILSIVLGYAVMEFEQKVLMPWFKSKPWFSKDQRAKELEADV